MLFILAYVEVKYYGSFKSPSKRLGVVLPRYMDIYGILWLNGVSVPVRLSGTYITFSLKSDQALKLSYLPYSYNCLVYDQKLWILTVTYKW